MFSQASKPIRTSGTTSRALKTEPNANTTRGSAREVEMMERSDNAAGQKDRPLRTALRVSRCDTEQQLQAREEECDHNRGEDFEEPFDPEMNDPPAPVFG